MVSFQTPGNDAKHKQMLARKDPNVYVRHWVTPLMKTCGARPGFCCYALWCGCCVSYGLRKQALHGDMTRYICCNGACPCSGRCGEQNCPEFCLCSEAFFCFGMSVASTRFMIQDELRVQTTACDNCIIGTMIALQWLACIFHIIACIVGSAEIQAAAHGLDLLADLVWCSVCACMQTQHKIEMDERDKGTLGAIGRPAIIVAPVQQAIPTGQPQVMYAGQPPAGQYQQYPPQQYPPQQYAQQPPGYPPQQAGSSYAQQYAAPPPGSYPGPPGAAPKQQYMK